MDTFILNNRFGVVIVNELIRLVNSVIHALGITYDIEELKSNYNTLNNKVGHNTAAITALNTKVNRYYLDVIYAGVGDDIEDIINNDNKYENFALGNIINVTTDNDNIIVCYPSNVTKDITLNVGGIDVQVSKTTENYNEVEYVVLKSLNAYEGQFSFRII